jgi:hypothetical protein
VGCENWGMGLDLGFYAARWYSLMRPPSTALDPLLGEVGDGVIWPWWPELAAAMGSLAVVMPGVLG